MSTQHVVGYFSNWITLDTLAKSLDGYTHIIFSFWQSPQEGVFGAAEAAVNNQDLIAYVQQQGKKCLLSAGGANFIPYGEYKGKPKEYGHELAKYALEVGYDGIDFDIENLLVPLCEKDLKWLAQATLAAKDYAKGQGKALLISHAPQAPYFPEYSKLEEMTDGNIDFYNIQYYNQGNWAYQAYDSFDKLFPTTFDGMVNLTSIASIAAQDVPVNKIILGKPITKEDAINSGFMELPKLIKAIRQAQHQHIEFGGVMGWKVDSDRNGEWGKAISIALNASPLSEPEESAEKDTVSV